MKSNISAHDIVAFAIVELNVPISLDVLYSMSPNDKLYKALIEAWKAKEKRADARTALLCAVMANCMGSGKKKYEPSDFMPKEPKSVQDKEAEIKSNFMTYMAQRKGK
jgi:hypothetical protein